MRAIGSVPTDAVHETLGLPSETVDAALVIVSDGERGAIGTTRAVVAAAEDPATLRAVTANVYAVPGFRPVKVADVPLTVLAAPPGVAVTV
jgi:hypothetical protein